MNKTTLEGNWNQLKGKIKQKWGKLTEDDLTRIDGHMDQLIGKIQELYGTSRSEVESEIHKLKR